MPRQIINKEISRLISREVRKQNIYVLNASKKLLKEIVKISFEIKKRGLPKHLVLKKLPKKLGFGIFLHPEAEPILKGEMIAPYSGEVAFVPQYLPDDSVYAFAPISEILFTKTDQALFDGKRSFHPKRLYQLNVDSVKKGNFTRFINHSDKPNIRAEFFKIPSNSYGLSPSPLEVVYLAKKKIHPGEQLLVCYEGDGGSYWGALGIKPIPVEPKTFQLDSFLRLERRRVGD
ncbi:MAG TPA: SET domain-containing protein-lysine N-methyltransferase [Rhabdochlamydiaceae bacterium]|nr:SET domain-containing protein-lysine N-methyltransferase [Rhabdochlamydiaceae bacterium]